MENNICTSKKKESSCSEDLRPPGSRYSSAVTEDYKINYKRGAFNPFRSNNIFSHHGISSRSLEFHKRFFPNITNKEWNDWRWQIQNRITRMEQLEKIIKLSEEEQLAINKKKDSLPLAITPYYASLLEEDNPYQAIRRSVVPVTAEYIRSHGEEDDPLKEDSHSPVPGIVHRYPDRVLFLVTGFCSTYCRYCTRSRIVGKDRMEYFRLSYWEDAIAYIESKPIIRDVLISGGDPLILSDENLEWLLYRLRNIPHVELLRIGSKVPVVLPQRITTGLINTLRKYHPLWMSIHAIHPDELTPEVREACCRLADAGIPLGSQTVLLSGINDCVDTMKKLVQGLLMMRVKPYYLYQCDPVVGSAHFRTPVKKGLEIISGLRGYTTGYAVPTYVIDAPGSGGKIPLFPESVVCREEDYIFLRNYEGKIYRYPDHE